MCHVSFYHSCYCVSHLSDCLHLFHLSDISLPSIVYLSAFPPQCHFCVVSYLHVLLFTHVTLV